MTALSTPDAISVRLALFLDGLGGGERTAYRTMRFPHVLQRSSTLGEPPTAGSEAESPSARRRRR
jgi:hypothetical protein